MGFYHSRSEFVRRPVFRLQGQHISQRSKVHPKLPGSRVSGIMRASKGLYRESSGEHQCMMLKEAHSRPHQEPGGERTKLELTCCWRSRGSMEKGLPKAAGGKIPSE